MYTILPIVSFGFSAFLGIASLNSPQRYRPLHFLMLTIFSLFSYWHIADLGLSLNATDTLAKFLIFYVSHMCYALLIEKHVLLTTSQCTDTWEWRGAYKMLFNARFIGTKKQAPDILDGRVIKTHSHSTKSDLPFLLPLFSITSITPRWGPARLRFMRNRIISLTSIYTIQELHDHFIKTPHPNYFASISLADFLPSKQTFFRRVLLNSISSPDFPTAREAILRTWLVVYFIWSAYALYTTLHDCLAIVFVGSGVDDPEDWPPLYGSLKEAYSIRRFWGKFWHRLVYRSYTSFGSLISLHVLKIPRHSIFGRMFINFFVFFMSGVIHSVVAQHLGFRCGFWEEIVFFIVNFGAIVAETVIQSAFVKLSRTMNLRCSDSAKRILGYAWVFVFLFWSLPKAEWPKILYTLQKMRM